jgi:hypothetical protein
MQDRDALTDRLTHTTPLASHPSNRPTHRPHTLPPPLHFLLPFLLLLLLLLPLGIMSTGNFIPQAIDIVKQVRSCVYVCVWGWVAYGCEVKNGLDAG